jgi:hypothetical protein
MTTLDRSARRLPERSRTPSWATNESSLMIGERAFHGPDGEDRRSLPELVIPWSPAGGPRSGWHAYRPSAGALLPSWVVELALTIERPFASSNDTTPAPRALLLARATGPLHHLAYAFRTAAWEIESLAGIGPPLPGLPVHRSRPEIGLDPVPGPGVLAHLRTASERGHAVGYRRRHAHAAGSVVWEATAGAVLTCIGRIGVSAQAVVAVAGHGDLAGLRPPAGGATVLRAWRCGRAWRPPGRGLRPDPQWALAVGVVLGSAAGGGLGRVARRHAMTAQDGGWDATVLTGPAALELARAGDPRYPLPMRSARQASREAVMEMLTACLTSAAQEATLPLPPGN